LSTEPIPSPALPPALAPLAVQRALPRLHCGIDSIRYENLIVSLVTQPAKLRALKEKLFTGRHRSWLFDIKRWSQVGGISHSVCHACVCLPLASLGPNSDRGCRATSAACASRSRCTTTAYRRGRSYPPSATCRLRRIPGDIVAAADSSESAGIRSSAAAAPPPSHATKAGVHALTPPLAVLPTLCDKARGLVTNDQLQIIRFCNTAAT
jgi:hypothetical protein